MKISEARGRLPEVAKYLQRNPDEVVLIEHRDLEERLALITESHLRSLETVIRELRQRLNHPFVLAGSLASERADEEIEAALRELRLDQGRIQDERLNRMMEEG